MAGLRMALSHLRYPSALSFLGLTSRTLSTGPPSATCTRFLPRQPSPAATRECPTPMIFIRARGLAASTSSEADPEDGGKRQEEDIWANWTGMFAEKGYSTVEIDITPAPDDPKPFPSMIKVLSGQIRLMANPFPPILVASGWSCLLAQGFVEDNPTSGLVLVDPPPDQDPRASSSASAGDAKAGASTQWEWPTFKYEPKFPILLLSKQGEGEELKADSRVARAVSDGVGRGGQGVSIEQMVDGSRGEQSRLAVEKWMDRCGF